MLRDIHLYAIVTLIVAGCCSAFVVPASRQQHHLASPATCEQTSAASHLYLSSSSSSTSIESDAANSKDASKCNRKPRKGDIVTIHWNLEPLDDFVAEPLFDTSGTISFVLHGGNYLPGLHEMISTMTPGESVENTALDAGWGERRAELVAKIPKGDQSGIDLSKIQIGTELMLSNGVKCVVTEISDDDFTIDANPPLAGASYAANVTLISVEEGPQQLLYREEGNDDMKETGRYDVATFALGECGNVRN